MKKNYRKMWSEISDYFQEDIQNLEELNYCLTDNGRLKKPRFESEAEQQDIMIIVEDNIGCGYIWHIINHYGIW